MDSFVVLLFALAKKLISCLTLSDQKCHWQKAAREGKKFVKVESELRSIKH